MIRGFDMLAAKEEMCLLVTTGLLLTYM